MKIFVQNAPNPFLLKCQGLKANCFSLCRAMQSNHISQQGRQVHLDGTPKNLFFFIHLLFWSTVWVSVSWQVWPKSARQPPAFPSSHLQQNSKLSSFLIRSGDSVDKDPPPLTPPSPLPPHSLKVPATERKPPLIHARCNPQCFELKDSPCVVQRWWQHSQCSVVSLCRHCTCRSWLCPPASSPPQLAHLWWCRFLPQNIRMHNTQQRTLSQTCLLEQTTGWVKGPHWQCESLPASPGMGNHCNAVQAVLGSNQNLRGWGHSTLSSLRLLHKTLTLNKKPRPH